MKNIRGDLVRILESRLRNTLKQHGIEQRMEAIKDFFKKINPDKDDALVDDYIWSNALHVLLNAQTIVIETEQLKIFDSIRKTTYDALEYRLPFEKVFLQLSDSYSTTIEGVDANLGGFLLSQQPYTRSDYVKEGEARKAQGRSPFPLEANIKDDFFINTMFVTAWSNDRKFYLSKSIWHSDDFHHEIYGNDESDRFRYLAIACIGYINCDNVYLHREGEVSDKVNRKREAKGKSRIEPYYVCRIRGVNYDSVATGTGATHSIRYDVRGHFRKLSTGKTTWVRPHQRGVHNELYVPKVYKVDGNSKPAWKG